MGYRFGTVARLLTFVFVFAMPFGSQALTLSEKAALQAAMQRHIDGQLVNGAYLFLDARQEQIRPLHPVTTHPMILRMGEHFVLCYDFRDDAGEQVLVDYYVAQTDGSYVVFHTEIANREVLHRLMEAGIVKRIDS